VLTEAHGFPHGLGCGLALPYTLKFNEPAIASILESLGRVVRPGTIVPAADVAKTFMDLVNSLAVPANLREAGITVEELPAFASAVVSVYPRTRNPRELTPALASSLVRRMYDGSLEPIHTGGSV
jgi:alcohol dehydrogenase class IV